MVDTPVGPATAGGARHGHGHICCLCHQQDEYRVIIPFINEGIALGERIVNITPERPDPLASLRAAGIAVDALRKDEQLALRSSETAYLRDGRFDIDAMLDTIQELLVEGKKLGFPRTRLIVHSEHVLADEETAIKFLEYEIRLNDVLAPYPDLIVCAYDLKRVTASMAIIVVRTHPSVLVGGTVVANSLFVLPEDYLKDVQERPGKRPT